MGGGCCEHCPRDGREDHDLRVKGHLGGDKNANTIKKLLKTFNKSNLIKGILCQTNYFA